MAIETHQQPLRLPRDLSDRLKAHAARRKLPVNTVVQTAVEHFLDAEDEKRDRRSESRRAVSAEAAAPRGLGLGRRAVPVVDLPVPESPAPVVVNVGAGAGSDGGRDLIARLATFVMSGPAFAQEQRLRQAVEMLRPSCQSEEERQMFAMKLDAAVAERGKVPAMRPRPLGGIGNLFR